MPRSAADRQLSPAPSHRERQRRYRLRLVTGRLSITTEFSQEETAKLHRLRYLTEGELEDRDRIAEAIHALLGNIADDL